MFRCVFIPCLLLVASIPAQAAKVKVWHHHQPAQFEPARLQQTVVTSEGGLRLARLVKPLARLDCTHVWDVVEDRDGNLYVATGDEGKIIKVKPDGSASVVFDSQESQVLCLAAMPDGSIIAGTGPSGLIIRITPDGNGRVIYDSPETYVWSLAVDPAGQHLHAGTGPNGRIYKVTPAGQASVFYTARPAHVLSLAAGADGTLYAGAGPQGLVYRIDPQGKGFVLFSAPQSEVRSLLVAGDSILAGTSSPVRRRFGGSSTTTTSGSGSVVQVGAVSSPREQGPQPAADKEAEKPAAADSKPREPEKATPAPAAAGPASGENSLYRIAADGTVREVFREKTLMLSLLRHDGRLLIGTGMDGQLFEVDETTRERTEIARLDHGQIHCLKRLQSGAIVLGTGDPGKLYVLQNQYADRGTVTSEVLDARIISKWGALRWQAETPDGTAVTVAVRSGNVADPDETWSDWSPEQDDAQRAVAIAPAARFIQYRVTLASSSPSTTPTVRSVSLRYSTTNQAPELTAVEVPDLDAVNLDNPKKLKLKWTATDANEDELTYSLFIRKDGWKSWVLLEEGLDRREFEWDTTTAPSGSYRLKVVASDHRDNPAEEALTGERISAPFVVSHQPPLVSVKVVGLEGDQAVIEATAEGSLVRLTAASFSVNGKQWVNAFPIDGLFDGTAEKFRFKTDALKPGSYVLVLRVKDAAGNLGTGDVVFAVQSRAR